MEIIRPGTNVDFVGSRKFWASVSLAAVVISLLLIAGVGLNYGIDFAGGTELQVKFTKKVSTGDLRKALVDRGFDKQIVVSMDDEGLEYLLRVEQYSALSEEQTVKMEKIFKESFGENLKGFSFNQESGEKMEIQLKSEVAVEKVGEALKKNELEDFNITIGGREGEYTYIIELESLADMLVKNLGKTFGDNGVTILGVEAVGSQVGKRLRTDGLLAVIYAIIGILIYVAFRFDTRFAPGAVLALAHDAIITVGLFAIFQFEVNMTVLAAVLTVVGYSVNDTIVIFDRIRENLLRFPEADTVKIINRSINETLSRTILTAGTTLLVTVVLLIFGGYTLFGFAFALTFGILVGTYSSIYVAAPLIILFEEQFGWGRKKAKT
ncbi:MAG: hypothetical protein Kow0090_10520 [Myxococcota bacterium]